MRKRLGLILAAAALVPLAAVGWWAADELAREVRERYRDELAREARLAGEQLPPDAFSDSAADRLGRVAGHRITLIGPDGTVLGDSEVPAARIPEVENHAGRPEVEAALEGEVGVAARASETVALSLLYVAVPHPGGAVRIAMPLRRVDELSVQIRRLLLIVGGAALLLILAALGPAARFVAAPAATLRRYARSVAEGASPRPPASWGGPELEAAGEALEELAARLASVREERDEAERAASLLDRLEEGVALVGPEAEVVHANRAFREWIGGARARGQRFGTLFRDPAITEALRTALGGEEASREVTAGDRITRFSFRPHDPGGAVVVLRDLTRLRRLEGVRRDFVANASHELKTPLTSVVGYAEALTDPELPREQVLTFGRRILENGRRMRSVIDDLLDLSRIEGGAWEPEPREVRLEAAARQVWGELAPGGAGQEEVTLELDLAGAATVTADPDAVALILRNLLDNAVRYAPPGSEVRVSSRPADGRVRVEVSDEGPGIPRAEQERIFERFYRVDEGRSREAGGTGLGLSIVKHLVDAHGGEVGVESRLGEGTTVWFTLPGPDATAAPGETESR